MVNGIGKVGIDVLHMRSSTSLRLCCCRLSPFLTKKKDVRIVTKAQETSVTPADVTLKHHKPPRTPAPSQLQSVHRPTASSFWMDEMS